jgi:putative membrane protein
MQKSATFRSSPVAADRVDSGDRARSLSIWFLIGHLAALIFGLAGMLIAIPNPELWRDSELGPRAYDFGMTYAGSLHIIFGAAAMFAYGMHAIGLRKTAIFFACSVPISLGSELIGTSTGEPFGNYAYSTFLGFKILGHVPFSIPLSWFYVGFANYLIGHALAGMWKVRPLWPYAVLIGAWLLTVWDLVLDPAMAHESLAVRFWSWSENGPYFGMPLQNFFGWTLTAVIFMAAARMFWMDDPTTDRRELRIWFPLAIFAANIAFASALSASVDLWIPIILAVVFGLLPAAWVVLPDRKRGHKDSALSGT